MNELKVFNHKELGGIRTLQKDGQVWFVGKEVANILGYGAERNALKQHVDEDDKLTHQISASGQNREMIIINESGLYSLILSSKLPKAKMFKKWVTSDILPSLRKNGTYSTNNDMEHLVQSLVQQTTTAVMAQIPLIVAETVKLTLNMVLTSGENGLNKPLAEEKPKKRRLQYHSKIDKLPQGLRNEVIMMIFQKNYTYMEVADSLKEQGHNFSYSAVGRFARRCSDEIGSLPGITIEE